MGLPLEQVVSDKSHYGTFICKSCSDLVTLDAVVTASNHPFCRSCLEGWIESRVAENLECICPVARTNLETDESHAHTITVAGRHILAEPIETAQPLAYSALQSVQVRCPEQGRFWVGDYSKVETHLVDHQLNTIQPSGQQTLADGGESKSDDEGKNGSASRPELYRPDDASRAGMTSRTGAHHGRTLALHAQQPSGISVVDQSALQRAMERCDKLKKQANAKFNRGDVEGARMLYSEGLALVAGFPIENDEVRVMMASLYSNRAVTYFRERILAPSIEDCDRSLELDPISEKTYIRKWRALSATGNNDAAIQSLKDGIQALPESQKLVDELRKATGPPQTPASGRADNLDMSYSIASQSHFADQSRQQEMELSVAGDPSPTVLDRTERLKKQANAKFNKGDIEAARILYSDALGCIPKGGSYSHGVNSLLSMLYSNRAVTFFRDKMYQESLEDCELAMELDPKSEKSYIRKARALVGMEQHDAAFRCLKEAARELPRSKKIAEELEKVGQGRDDDDDEDHPDSGKADNLTSADSANNSIGSFNFYITPDGTKKGTDGYSEELDLADKLKRNANAKFNRGDIAGARLLYTEALACLPNDKEDEEVRACLASLYANRAVTFFREKEYGPSTWDCDKAIELDPHSEKSYIRKARALNALQRFSETVLCLEHGMKEIPGSSRLREELSKAKDQVAMEEAKAVENGDKGTLTQENAKDFQVSYSSFGFDPNSSSGSGGMFVSPTKADRPIMDSVPEGQSQEFALPFNGENDAFERAEKLKKQANAKLNKGDVTGARVLYGEGLACLPTSGSKSPEGRELAASLYANRAVTFFREKKFLATVIDCNKSLELDAKHEKSYIRKWRALMALGNFEDAFNCLADAVREIPDSERLNEELVNAEEQKELLAKVNHLIDVGAYDEARELLKPIVKTSDNVSLWLAAARADACLGFTESSLERVNKVLLFNPKHGEALHVRGYAVFLSGEMEHGINLLREALEADIENVSHSVSNRLENCQKTFSIFGKGQARVKRGRYKEAVDLFTSSLEDGERIPDEAPLYGLFLTERAEASLLSNQFEAALQDCIAAIRLKHDNMTAWTVKVEVYFALGRLQEARDELYVVRKSWGAGNETIEDAYKKTDFELRLKRADDDVYRIMASVDERRVPDFHDGEPMHFDRKNSLKPQGLRSPRMPNQPSRRKSKQEDPRRDKRTRANSRSGREARRNSNGRF